MFDSQASVNPLLWINRTRWTALKWLKGALLKICNSAFVSPRCSCRKHVNTIWYTCVISWRSWFLHGWMKNYRCSFLQFCAYLLQSQRSAISQRVWMNDPVLLRRAETLSRHGQNSLELAAGWHSHAIFKIASAGVRRLWRSIKLNEWRTKTKNLKKWKTDGWCMSMRNINKFEISWISSRIKSFVCVLPRCESSFFCGLLPGFHNSFERVMQQRFTHISPEFAQYSPRSIWTFFFWQVNTVVLRSSDFPT